MNKKTIAFGLLTTVAIAAPIAVVVSCGSEKQTHRRTLSSGRVNRVDQTQDLKTKTLKKHGENTNKTPQITNNANVK